MSYYGPRTNATLRPPSGPPVTVSHLTVWRSTTGTMDYLPVCPECLVDDLAEVIERIAKALEAEHRGGATTLVANMQRAAKHLEAPVQHAKRPFTW
jgi:hypothetical protein